MPFLTTIESVDWYLLDTLSKLLERDPEAKAHLLSLPILKDGASDDLTTEIPLQYLALRDPDAAEAVRNLPWIHDSVTPDSRGDLNWEVKAVGDLVYLAVNASDAFWSLMGRPWMGIAQGETIEKAQVIGSVVGIARLDPEAGGQVSALPFLATLEREDGLMLTTLYRLVRADPEGTRRVLSGPALAGGTSHNPPATLALQYLKGQDPEVSAAIQSLPWVRDGVAPFRHTGVSSSNRSKASRESLVVLGFLELFLSEREAALALLKSSWVFDGLDNWEYTALTRLQSLGRSRRAAQVAEMPFLQTFERNDLIALEVLEELSRNDSTGLRQLLSAP